MYLGLLCISEGSFSRLSEGAWGRSLIYRFAFLRLSPPTTTTTTTSPSHCLCPCLLREATPCGKNAPNFLVFFFTSICDKVVELKLLFAVKGPCKFNCVLPPFVSLQTIGHSRPGLLKAGDQGLPWLADSWPSTSLPANGGLGSPKGGSNFCRGGKRHNRAGEASG